VVFWPTEAQQPAIIVTSVPKGATVFVDGIRKGLTPLKVPVADAKRAYRVKVQLTNHEPHESIVRLSGDPPQVQIVAPLTPLTGKLAIHSKPTGADIYINDEYRGTTPFVIQGLSLTEEAVFELRKRGYRSVDRRVKWEEQTYHLIRVTLRKLR